MPWAVISNAPCFDGRCALTLQTCIVALRTPALHAALVSEVSVGGQR